MLKALFILIAMVGIVSPLTVEVNNIHYGYKNIYISTQMSLESSTLTMSNYKITKQDLPFELLGFIKHKDTEMQVDFSKLIRKYAIQDIDIQSPLLRFQFEQRTYIVVTILSESQEENDVSVLSHLINLGKDQQQL